MGALTKSYPKNKIDDATQESIAFIKKGRKVPSGGDATDATKALFDGRRLIIWEIPFVATQEQITQNGELNESQRRFVQMYINPQNLQFSSRKLVTETRTKGGYVTQYWGEELDGLNLQGTTGDSGIEGIEALRGIYRAEQIALLNLINRDSGGDLKRRQSLAQLAASVIMWYDGQGMSGYFTDMSYTESAQKPGVFDYQLNFKVTRVIGQRHNFMPWHRRPPSTPELPFTEEEIGVGGPIKQGAAGDLNVPPIADVRDDGIVFHKNDPRDLGVNYGDPGDEDGDPKGAARYTQQRLSGDRIGALDQISKGLRDTVSAGFDNVADASVQLALKVIGRSDRIRDILDS